MRAELLRSRIATSLVTGLAVVLGASTLIGMGVAESAAMPFPRALSLERTPQLAPPSPIPVQFNRRMMGPRVGPSFQRVTPGGRYPGNIATPGHNRPHPPNWRRPRGPGIGPGLAIGTGIIIGSGIIGSAIAAQPPGGPPPGGMMPPGRPGAALPPGASAPPPGGPQGPRGPQLGINVPPANENRFVKNEVVLELPDNYSPAAASQLLARHRLVPLEQQTLALTNTTFIRARITGNRSVRTVLRRLTREVTLRSGQPNYLFAAAQAVPAARELPQLQPPPDSAVTAAPADKPDDRKTAPAPSQTALPQLQQLQPQPQQAQTPQGFVPASGPTPAAIPTAAVASTLPAKGDPAQYTLSKLKLAEAHSISLGNNILVAVIDSAVDTRHPELAGVIAQTYDALGTGEKPHQHGTAVAGAIAARSRLLGVAPAARILAIQAFGVSGTTAEATTFAILKGVEYAVSQNARVINMSFTGPHDPGLARHIAAAYRKGAVLVAASGNLGPKSPPQYPAADRHVIAVTATDSNDSLYVAANRGRHVAVAAPGVDILLPAPGAGYWMASGTSFATAHVSGVAALILARQPSLSPDALRQILISTARDLGTPGRDPLFGAGLTDAHRALLATAPQSVAAPAADANAAAR